MNHQLNVMFVSKLVKILGKKDKVLEGATQRHVLQVIQDDSVSLV